MKQFQLKSLHCIKSSQHISAEWRKWQYVVGRQEVAWPGRASHLTDTNIPDIAQDTGTCGHLNTDSWAQVPFSTSAALTLSSQHLSALIAQYITAIFASFSWMRDVSKCQPCYNGNVLSRTTFNSVRLNGHSCFRRWFFFFFFCCSFRAEPENNSRRAETPNGN